MKIQNGISLKPQTPEELAAKQDAALRDAGKMYENYFLNEMVKAMRSTVHKDEGFIKPSMAENIFSEQLDQKYVEGWANRGGIGLADMIYTQIRDKYFGATPKTMPGQHMLPVSPKKEPIGIPSTDSIQMKAIAPQNGAKMSYRFEIQNPSGAFDAQAPMPGVVTEARSIGQGWNTVRLDHGHGLSSEMTFPGRVAEIPANTRVAAGRKLGVLDPERPVLAWNLDWT